MTYTSEEAEAYGKWLIGRKCPIHPTRIVQPSKYSVCWCGAKEFNGYCTCGSPTQEFLNQYRLQKAKEQL